MSFDEMQSMSDKELQQKAKRTALRAQEGWEDIVPAAGKWVAKNVNSVTPGARLVRFKRTGTISDVYLEFMTRSVLRACRKIAGKHRLQFEGSEISLKDVYKTFAMDIYIRAIREVLPSGTDRTQLRTVVKKAKKHLHNALGVNRYLFVRSKFLIDCETARTKLSRTFRRHIGFGQDVNMDEKQKKFRGATPCIKKAPNKPGDNKIGHWTTQCSAILNATSEPYVVGLYPFSGNDKDGFSFETRLKIWKWLVDLMRSTKPQNLPVVVCDSFYLDNASREMLQKEKILYHCSVKMNWFQSIGKHLDAKVNEMGAWAAMYNRDTDEVACRTWCADANVGKKLLLSTLLRKTNGEQPKDQPPGWIHYLDCFNACDAYNVKIGTIWWPYRIMHWSKHFDEMFHVHVILNTVAVWRECARQLI